MKEKYFSQYKQDEFLDKNIFNKKRKGFFVEIGAHNGISFSNSYFFEKYRNWGGICVEPIPERYDDLKKNRKCYTVWAAIDISKGEKEFIKVEGYSEMLSGLKNTYNKKHLNRLEREINDFGGSYKEIKVPVIVFSELIEQFNVKVIDFISIDTEGNELNILKTIDFLKVIIDTILVENNYKSSDIPDFLKKQNFILINEIGVDQIYRNKNMVLRRQILNFKIKKIKNRIIYIKKNFNLKKFLEFIKRRLKKIQTIYYKSL